VIGQAEQHSLFDVIVADDRIREQADVRHLLFDLCGCHAHFYPDYRAAYEAVLDRVGERLLINYQLGGKNFGAVLLQKLKKDGLDLPTVVLNCRPRDRNAIVGFCGTFDFVHHVIEANELSTQAPLIQRAFQKRGAQRIVPGKAKVFVIHGHDLPALSGGTESSLRRITRILSVNFELETIVLKGEALNGQTLINLMEARFKDASVAIALFTSDDVGRLRSDTRLNSRVRQNVLFETGFARGFLGGQRTIILQDSDKLELPSDLGGLRSLRLSDTDQELMISLKALFDQLGIDAPLRNI
jgi:predicted nucleotide-binding protein